IDCRLVNRPHHVAEKSNGRALLKITRRIQTAAVIEQHRHAHRRVRSRDVANRLRLAVDRKFEVFEPQIRNRHAASIDYSRGNRNQMCSDADDLVALVRRIVTSVRLWRRPHDWWWWKLRHLSRSVVVRWSWGRRGALLPPRLRVRR